MARTALFTDAELPDRGGLLECVCDGDVPDFAGLSYVGKRDGRYLVVARRGRSDARMVPWEVRGEVGRQLLQHAVLGNWMSVEAVLRESGEDFRPALLTLKAREEMVRRRVTAESLVGLPPPSVQISVAGSGEGAWF